MAVPSYQDMMLPFLEVLANGKEQAVRDIKEAVATKLGITDEDRKELLPSGNQSYFDNRVGWARTYLKKAGLIEAKSRGHFTISSHGLQALAQKPVRIDVAFLKQYDQFNDFLEISASGHNQDGKQESTELTTSSEEKSQTPDEIIENQFLAIRSRLEEEILKRVKDCSPYFFEQLVVDLLVSMGYGGSRKEAGQATKASGDEGIDGIIKEDRLGLDQIYIQAKRWEGAVTRPELQKFAGALQGQRAKKGIFITTSTFSTGAVEFCRNIDSKIILIDGSQLAKLMIDFNVGVSTAKTFEIKHIDTDYFESEGA